ncbi:hypothetical protein [Thalassolituus sp.]|jgi:hypothetical protein|nr:hypothetical protein [Thalassolituus sp.]
MDWTAIGASVSFADILTFMGVVVTAGFGVRVALKGVSLAKSALAKG